MAGVSPDFDAAAFRDAILFAMRMGAAPDPADQPVFHFASDQMTVSAADAAGVPFDPAATVVHTGPAPVSVPCTVEYIDDKTGVVTHLGVIQPTHVRITLIDTEYEKIRGCTHVVIDGDTYVLRRTEPPAGLFDVGVFVLHFHAMQET